jgi:peptidoglycan/LPS O-acetylase OafA/YrhL
MEIQTGQRRYDLDWLRVLGFALVFLYHGSRFFDSSAWHIKNGVSSPLVDGLKSIFDLWGMPLLFFISGASIVYALRPGGEVRFVRQRVLRLLVPLAFGILVLAPPQIYLERLTHGDFQGSFIEFLPLYFRDWTTWGGNFAWSGVHLWYLEDLFLFSLVLLPVFVLLKRPAGRRAVEALARFSSPPGRILLWLLPFALWLIPFDPLGIVGGGLSEDLSRLVVFPAFVVFGYLVYSHHHIQQSVVRQRRLFLGLALALMLAAPLVEGWAGEHRGLGTLVVVMLLIGLLIWSTLLAIVGYGMRYLTFGHPRLADANEAVLPIYILHQPVILIIGFFVVGWPLPMLAKYLIIVVLAFGLTLGLYAFGVRRWDPLRWLFGLKPRRTPPSRPAAAVPAVAA